MLSWKRTKQRANRQNTNHIIEAHTNWWEEKSQHQRAEQRQTEAATETTKKNNAGE